MTPTTTADASMERERFETARKAAGVLDSAFDWHDGRYTNPMIGAQWVGWQARAAISETNASTEPCDCETCREARFQAGERVMIRMVTCALCGNKRCPHATDHRLSCTNSNDPGQWGSSHGTRVEAAPKEAAEPTREDARSPFVWLWTHCRALGMTKKSDNGTMEHDVALFVHELVNAPRTEAAAKVAARSHGDSVGERAKHVGAWETPEGYVCFGSWMALSTMVTYLIRDMAAPRLTHEQWLEAEASPK